MKLRKWEKKLTAQERKHLKEQGVHRSLHAVRHNMEYQARMRAKYPEPIHEPCWTCKTIATKLYFFCTFF